VVALYVVWHMVFTNMVCCCHCLLWCSVWHNLASAFFVYSLELARMLDTAVQKKQKHENLFSSYLFRRRLFLFFADFAA
jgi:uncharacterized membrane protein SpoIIM required for sporulation